MFLDNLVEDLEHEIGAVFKILDLAIKTVGEIVQIFFLKAFEEFEELTEYLLIHNLFIYDQNLTGVSIEQLLEKVGDLYFQTLLGRVHQMSRKRCEEGVLFLLLVGTEDEFVEALRRDVNRLLEGYDDLHTVNLHLIQIGYLISTMRDPIVRLNLDEFFEVFYLQLFLWVLVLFEKSGSVAIDFFRQCVLELNMDA